MKKKEFLKVFGNRIIEKYGKYSGAGDKWGVDASFISNIKAGRKTPTPKMLKDLDLDIIDQRIYVDKRI